MLVKPAPEIMDGSKPASTKFEIALPKCVDFPEVPATATFFTFGNHREKLASFLIINSEFFGFLTS